MSIPFSNTHHRVPRGFGNILEGLTREILRDQPKDIPVFAAAYFEDLLKQREELNFDPVEWGAKLEDRFYNNGTFKQPQPSRSKDKSGELAPVEASRFISDHAPSEKQNFDENSQNDNVQVSRMVSESVSFDEKPQSSRSKDKSGELAPVEASRVISDHAPSEKQNFDENSKNDKVRVSRLVSESVSLDEKEQTEDVIKNEADATVQAHDESNIEGEVEQKIIKGTDTQSQFTPSSAPEVDIFGAKIDEIKLKDYMLPLDEDQNTTVEPGISKEYPKESSDLGLHQTNVYDNLHNIDEHLNISSTEQEMSQAEKNSAAQVIESPEDDIESMQHFSVEPLNNNISVSENLKDNDTNVEVENMTELKKGGIEEEHMERYAESVNDLQEERRIWGPDDEHVQKTTDMKEHDDAKFKHHIAIVHEFQATETEQEEAEIPIANRGDNEFSVTPDRITIDDEIKVERLELTNDGSEVRSTQEEPNSAIENTEAQGEHYVNETDDENQIYHDKDHIAEEYLVKSDERLVSLDHEFEDLSPDGQKAREKEEENGNWAETLIKQEEEVLDIPLDDPDANAAAAKIQAGFRGHMTRKKMKGGEIDVKHKEAGNTSAATAGEEEA